MSSIQRKIWEERAGLQGDTTSLNEEFTSLIQESYEYDSSDVTFVFGIMEDVENIMEALPKAAYVSAMRNATDPDNHSSKVDPDSIVARAQKHHGAQFANDLKKGADKMHYPRPNHTFGSDNLKTMSRSSSPSHVTKAGKLTKASVKGLKSTIKSRMAD